jgi:hypothetical protein
MSGFLTFSAIPGDKSVAFAWTYDQSVFNPANITELTIYVTDKLILDDTVRTTSRMLEPFATNYVGYANEPTLDTVVTDLTNGTEYIFSVEVIVNDTIIYNSDIAVATPAASLSDVPPRPYFRLLQTLPGAFTLQLLNSVGITPTASVITNNHLDTYSAFDNGAHIYAAYIVYSDAHRIRTKRFEVVRDANNKYSQDFVVDVSLNNWHEVNVKVENRHGISELSYSDKIYVDIYPSAPNNCKVIENIVLGGQPEIKVTWAAPTFLGQPHLDSYEIQRKKSTDVSYSDLATIVNITDLSYCDTSVVLDTVYNYRIRASNYDLSTDPVPERHYSDYVVCDPSNIRAVVFPTITSVSKTPSNGKFTVDIVADYGSFPQSNITYDISVNDATKNVTGSSSNSIDISGTNGTTYYFQARVVAQSVVDGTKYYTSDWFEVQWSMPYEPLTDPTSVSATPLDTNGNPINGGIALTWTDPVTNAYVNADFYIDIYVKERTAPDASYAFVNSIYKNNQAHTVPSLTNGTLYTFKLFTKQYNQELGDFVYSDGTVFDNADVPFTYPSSITNLSFSNGTLAYSFTPVTGSNTGGLSPVGYNNGSADISTSGTVSSSPGTNNTLTVSPFVTYNGNRYYGSSVSASAFSTPNTPDNFAVNNISNNVPLNEQIYISWSLPSGHDSATAVYNVFRYLGGVETLVSTGQTTTDFTDTGLTNGTTYTYKVELLVGNGVSSGKSSASAQIMPFTYADDLLDSDVLDIVVNSTTVDISFSNASVGNSGLDTSKLLYKFVWDHVDSNNVSLQDSSGVSMNVTTPKTTIYNLTVGYKYSLRIYTGVMPGGFNSSNKYYSTTYLQKYITSYDVQSIIAPAGLVVYSSDKSFLADWTDNVAATVSGLTIDRYRLYYTYSGLNSSDITFQYVTNALYTQNGLTNGTLYNVYLAYVYKDVLGRDVFSADSSASATPNSAPNSPQNLFVESITNGSVVVSWDVDNSTPAISNYSIYINGEVWSTAHLPLTSFSSENDRLSIVISPLTIDVSYNVSVYAEINLGGSSYSVSGPSSVVVNSYSTRPGPAGTISYVPTSETLNVSWVDATQKGNASQYGNGSIQYFVKLYNADTNDFVAITSIIDISSCQFSNLVDGTNYTIEVYTVYKVANSNTYAESAAATLSPVQSYRQPNSSSIVASAANTSTDGKTITLTFDYDSDFNASDCTFMIQRIVYNGVTNAQLSDNTYNANTFTGYNNSNNGSVGQILTDTGFGDINFLNGNIVTYKLAVTYNLWTPNYSPTYDYTAANVIPYGKPLFVVPPSISNNTVTVQFSKNGIAMNSMILVGIDPSNNSIPVKMYNNAELAALNYNNVQTATTATNQIFTIQADMGIKITEVLVILANPGATVLASHPSGSGTSFGDV